MYIQYPNTTFQSVDIAKLASDLSKKVTDLQKKQNGSQKSTKTNSK